MTSKLELQMKGSELEKAEMRARLCEEQAREALERLKSEGEIIEN
jgi:hypothetical protein